MQTLIFGKLAGLSTDGVPLSLFYLSGNIIWLYFSSIVSGCADTFSGNAFIFGKVYFPRLTAPLSHILTCLADFFIRLSLFMIFNLLLGLKTGNFYFATKLYLENKKNYNEHDKNYLKNKIYNLFEQFSIVDGLKSEIWDLYALFIQENEINENNKKEDNINIIKNIIELRLKEIRTLMVKNLNWEENEKVKDILSTIIKNMKSLLEKIDNDKKYVFDKELSINNLEEKIKKSYEKK
jgi:hypothetical protein